MKLTSTAAVGLAGLLTTGLVALPVVAFADDDLFKRDDDTPGVTQVNDDDGDDDGDRTRNDRDTRSKDTNNTRSKNTKSNNTRSDRSKTGSRSGRDNSRNKKVKDWTRDGGDRTRDWSRNKTNDRSRNNTR
ncbi:hypothetical protein FXB39_12595 [Nocardioides sp. BGMRC 2183]|nr:hypothetical protein FXB39_12595 [Nocardioides sp. BGMRC 2183]